MWISIISAWLLLLVSGLLLLPGCSLVYFAYFRNHSVLPVELNLRLNPYYSETTPVVYKKAILAIDKITYKKLDDSLFVNRMDSGMISIKIPPQSTVLLPRWSNFIYDTVILKQLSRIDSICIISKLGAAGSFQTKKSGFPVSYIYIYDYR